MLELLRSNYDRTSIALTAAFCGSLHGLGNLYDNTMMSLILTINQLRVLSSYMHALLTGVVDERTQCIMSCKPGSTQIWL